MGKLSAAQQKQLADLEKLRDSDDDEEVSVWVRNADGHETRLTGERAERWLARNGYDIDDADDSSADEPLEGKNTPPAKKAAAPAKKATADTDPDDSAPLEGDPPSAAAPRQNKKFF